MPLKCERAHYSTTLVLPAAPSAVPIDTMPKYTIGHISYVLKLPANFVMLFFIRCNRFDFFGYPKKPYIDTFFAAKPAYLVHLAKTGKPRHGN